MLYWMLAYLPRVFYTDGIQIQFNYSTSTFLFSSQGTFCQSYPPPPPPFIYLFINYNLIYKIRVLQFWCCCILRCSPLLLPMRSLIPLLHSNMFFLHLVAFQRSEETLAYFCHYLREWDRQNTQYKRVIYVIILKEIQG